MPSQPACSAITACSTWRLAVPPGRTKPKRMHHHCRMLQPFTVQTTDIADLLVIDVKEISDGGGVVREFFRTSAFEEAGVKGVGTWLQVNVTESVQGAVRGLHGEDMHKLVGIAFGEAFGAYVDTRATSPTRG